MVGEVVAWSVVMSDDESGVSLDLLAVGHECANVGQLGREGAPRYTLKGVPLDPL